jgi:hypothetical protein
MSEKETTELVNSIYEVGKDTSRSKTRNFCDSLNRGFNVLHGDAVYTREAAGVQSSCGNDTVTLDLNEGAVLFAYKTMVQASKIIAPMFVSAYGLAGMFKNACKQLRSCYNHNNELYQKAFGRDPLYSVGYLEDDLLGMKDVVVVADDGFGNHTLVQAIHLGEIHDAKIIMRVFEQIHKNDVDIENKRTAMRENGACIKAMEEAGCYDPQWTSEFVIMPKESAIDMAEEKACAIRKDLHLTAADKAEQEQV